MEKNTGVSETTIPGYFIAMGSEEIASVEGQQHFNGGRAGIFHTKEKLVETIVAKPMLREMNIAIVSISVPENAVINSKDGKFGIKKGGKISIINTEFMN